MIRQGDARARRARMLEGVRERFLRDPEERKLDVRCGTRAEPVTRDRHCEAGARRKPSRMGFQRRHEAVVVEQRRTQVGHRLPHTVHRVLQQLLDFSECRGIRTARHLAAQGLQRDAERGQVLADEIMQVGGDAAALGLLGRGQAPEQRPDPPLAFALRPVGAQQLGHVAPDAAIAEERTGRVEHRLAADRIVEEHAV